MVVENLVQIGNPLLSRKSIMVNKRNVQESQIIIENLVDSMFHHGLVWIASNQIWERLRIFITQIRKTVSRNLEEDELRVFINPEIKWASQRQSVMYEGCGSVAYSKLFAPVSRPEQIIIEALDENRKKFSLRVEWILSRVIQHEYDHLDGIAFTEKITDIRKIMSLEEYRKMMVKKENN